MQFDPFFNAKNLLRNHSKDPIQWRVRNAETGNEEVTIEYPINPESAYSLACMSSVLADSEQEDEGIMSSAAQVKALSFAYQDKLTPKESIIAAAFFDMGLKTGSIIGKLTDLDIEEFRKAHLGRSNAQKNNSHWTPFRKFLTNNVKDFIRNLDSDNPMKESLMREKIKDEFGRAPARSTYSRWVDNLKERGDIFDNRKKKRRRKK